MYHLRIHNIGLHTSVKYKAYRTYKGLINSIVNIVKHEFNYIPDRKYIKNELFKYSWCQINYLNFKI
jgi:hypothetical protein